MDVPKQKSKEHPIESYEAWLAEARAEEPFAYLDDRLTEAFKAITALREENTHLKANRNLLLELLKNHKHDAYGNVMFPSGIVTFTE